MKTRLARGIMLATLAPLVFAPLAAQAGTRASDTNARYYASASAERGLQRAAKEEDRAAGLFGIDLQMLLIGPTAIGMLAALAIDGESVRTSFQSNGAN